MINKIEQYKLKSGLSYNDIALTVGYTRTTVFKAIKTPWRTKWETLEPIIKKIAMPEDEALKVFCQEKKDENDNRWKKKFEQMQEKLKSQ